MLEYARIFAYRTDMNLIGRDGRTDGRDGRTDGQTTLIVLAQTSKPGCGSDLTGSLPIKSFAQYFGGALGPLSPWILHPLSLNSSEEKAALPFL
jgi:hypothetical protein